MPLTHLERIQAIIVLAQSLPLLVTNNVLGGLAEVAGAPLMLGCCAAVAAVAGVAGLCSPVLRSAALTRVD